MTRGRRALGALITTVVLATLLGVGSARADYISYIPSSGSLNLSDSIPGEVDPQRFATLMTLVAGYYDLGIDGETYAIAGEHDGSNTIGFSYGLDQNTLGQYAYWLDRVYRSKRICKTKHHRRRCHRIQVYLYTEVSESDIAFNANYYWNVGPGYPAADQMDLPRVAFHEFGHWSDPNAPHDARCTGSPLTETTDYGEWWRSYDDWYEADCPDSPSYPSEKRAQRTFHRVQIVRHWLAPRILREHQRARPRAGLRKVRVVGSLPSSRTLPAK